MTREIRVTPLEEREIRLEDVDVRPNAGKQLSLPESAMRD